MNGEVDGERERHEIEKATIATRKRRSAWSRSQARAERGVGGAQSAVSAVPQSCVTLGLDRFMVAVSLGSL